MLRYTARRLVIAVFTLFIIATMTFFIMQLLPGTPFNDEKLSDEAKAQLEAKYGLDDPLVVQYARYMANMAQGDFGNSFYYNNTPVFGILLGRFPVSAFLGIQAMVVGVFVGMALGIVGALKHNTFWDSTATVVAVLGISIPSFVLGPLMQYWVGVKLGWLPIAFFDSWQHSIMPSIALSVFVIAIIARFMRTEMLEVLAQDYITLAKAKGLSALGVVLRHAVRNSLIPVVTVIFPLVVGLVTGSLVIEQIFAIPGIGELFVTSIVVNDYFMIMGTTVFFAVLFVVALLIQDIAYGIIDPRIRVSGGKE
ncbi:MAG: ABC transporter permease [Actinomycetota bacterium]|nr:ABC transporter permease [Actinomycetota bacterium]